MTPAAPAVLASTQAQGIALACAAIFTFTLMDATAKHLTQAYPPAQVVWARFAVNLLILLIVFRARTPALMRSARPRVQLWRALMQVASVGLFFTAIQTVGLAEATAIMDLNPVLVTLGAALFLGERLGPWRLLGVLLALIGALVIIRPGAGVFQPAALLPLVGACTYAAGALLTRMARVDSVATAVLWSAVVGTALASLTLPFVWTPVAAADLPWFLAVGAFGTISQALLVRAYALAEAGALAPYGYTGLVWAGLWGALFFGQVPDGWSLVGAGLIVAAGLIVWMRERRRTGG